MNGVSSGKDQIESLPMDFSELSDLILTYWFEQTGGGAVAHWAHSLFDPLFSVLHRLALALIWW